MSRVKVTYPDLSTEQVIERLKHARTILGRRLGVSKILLYGSYATGRQTAASDIDVIVLYEGEAKQDAYKIVMEVVGIPRLEPRIYTSDQFNTMMLQSAKFAETIRKEGILITPQSGET